MSADRELERVVRSWLREDGLEDADRVLDAALTEIDTTPQRRATWWPTRRFVPMSTRLQIALATAAVVILAFLGLRLLGGGPNIGTPSATSTPTLAPTLAPSPAPTPIGFSELGGAIPPGPVILDGSFPLAIEFDVPAGWEAHARDQVSDEVSLSRVRGDLSPAWVEFSIVGNVYPDPCHPVGMDPALGPTVDELVDALTTLEGFEAGAVSDVDVDGHPGKRFDLTTSVVPAEAGCDDDVWLTMWRGAAGTQAVIPGPTNMRFTIVEVDGTRLVMWTESWDTTTPVELAEANAIVDSVRFK